MSARYVKDADTERKLANALSDAQWTIKLAIAGRAGKNVLEVADDTIAKALQLLGIGDI